ncbi:hypothetical protein GH733_005194 [Mirounga leonina]|nr:hypothetical protein GH733_005194 [Mirounga leonina]
MSVSPPSTMALQQAQMLLSMNSLESVNAGVQQNNTESFAVALCHLAELHAEQVSVETKGMDGLWLRPTCTFISCPLPAPGKHHIGFRDVRTASSCTVLLSVAELYWRSSSPTIALPVLLQALALSKEYRLQYLASETLILGIPEQALSLLHMAIEPILADGAVLDKGRAMFLVAKCQVASAASYDPPKKAEALEAAIENLNEAKNYFAKVDCKEQIRDVVYFQARLYHTLGKTQERNRVSETSPGYLLGQDCVSKPPKVGGSGSL